MGILIDFKEAKAKLTDSQTPISISDELDDAVEAFAFAQLPKRHRIALVLAGIYGGDAESQLENADQIGHYMEGDFTVPYKVPTPRSEEPTMADILS